MTKFKDTAIEPFLDALASSKATPGGGSAAAIIGATMPRPPQPQTIYVAPCDINARIARAC